MITLYTVISFVCLLEQLNTIITTTQSTSNAITNAATTATNTEAAPGISNEATTKARTEVQTATTITATNRNSTKAPEQNSDYITTTQQDAPSGRIYSLYLMEIFWFVKPRPFVFEAFAS